MASLLLRSRSSDGKWGIALRQQLVRAGAGFATCKAWGGHWGASCMVRGKPMLRDTQQLVRAGAGFATCKAWGGHWGAICSDRGY